MAIASLSNTVDVAFDTGTTANGPDVANAINDIRADLKTVNEGGTSSGTITSERVAYVTASPTTVDLNHHLPIMYGLKFSSAASEGGRKIVMTGGGSGYINYQGYKYPVSALAGDATTDQIVYYDFDDAATAGSTISLQLLALSGGMPALANEDGTIRRFIFAILSYVGAEPISTTDTNWQLSVVAQNELLHAGLLQAGTIDAERIAANSLTASKLDTDSLGSTSIKISSGGYISSELATHSAKLSGEISGTFIVGESVDQATTGAEGLVNNVESDHIIVIPTTGTFAGAYTITGADSGATITTVTSGAPVAVNLNRKFQELAKAGFFLGHNDGVAPATMITAEVAGHAFDIVDAGGNGISFSTGRPADKAFLLHGDVVATGNLQDNSVSTIYRHWEEGPPLATFRWNHGVGAAPGAGELLRREGDLDDTQGVIKTNVGNTITMTSYKGDFGQDNDDFDVASSGDYNPDRKIRMMDDFQPDGHGIVLSSIDTAVGDVGSEWQKVSIPLSPFSFTPLATGDGTLVVSFNFHVDAGSSPWSAFKVIDTEKNDNTVAATRRIKMIAGSNNEGYITRQTLYFPIALVADEERSFELFLSTSGGVGKMGVSGIYWEITELYK